MSYHIVAHAYDSQDRRIKTQGANPETYIDLLDWIGVRLNPETGVGVHPQCPVARVTFDVTLPPNPNRNPESATTCAGCGARPATVGFVCDTCSAG